MITYDQERGYKFLTYFERANRLYRDSVLSIQKVNESYMGEAATTTTARARKETRRKRIRDKNRKAKRIDLCC